MTPGSPESNVHAVEHVLLLTLGQVAIVIAAARVTGNLARRIGQPRAVGEIVAGLLLGPSAFGVLAPDTSQRIFGSTDIVPISILSQIGLVLLMFQIGLEFDFSHLGTSENRRAVSLISVVGIVAPFGAASPCSGNSAAATSRHVWQG